MTVSTVPRPYLLTYHASDHTYPVTSGEAQRLIDTFHVLRALPYRVVLQGDHGERSTLRPATIGGGPAFLIDKGGR